MGRSRWRHLQPSPANSRRRASRSRAPAHPTRSQAEPVKVASHSQQMALRRWRGAVRPAVYEVVEVGLVTGTCSGCEVGRARMWA
jgi:hypothetical protein